MLTARSDHEGDTGVKQNTHRRKRIKDLEILMVLDLVGCKRELETYEF